ncbi:hypothetical protein Tco_0344654 [Tanacetum coccineum]
MRGWMTRNDGEDEDEDIRMHSIYPKTLGALLDLIYMETIMLNQKTWEEFIHDIRDYEDYTVVPIHGTYVKQNMLYEMEMQSNSNGAQLIL